jgi:alpha-glucosidase
VKQPKETLSFKLPFAVMKKMIILLLFITAVTGTTAQQPPRLFSPDKTIRVDIRTNDQLAYSVFVDDKKIINESVIDMQLQDGNALSKNLKIRSAKTKSVNEMIVAQIPVSRKNIPDVYNELGIQFKNNFTVTFRAYNDGIAYRISTSFKDTVIIKNEIAQFNFNDDAHAWAPVIQKRDSLDIYHTSFEELYPYRSLYSLSNNDCMFNPVLVNTQNIKVAITESDLDNYPGMFLKGTSSNGLRSVFAPYPLEEKMIDGEYPEMTVSRRADFIAKTNGTRDFPWRCLLIARQDKELPVNDLVYRLSSPSKIEDVSWIHTGKCTDEWIIDVNLFNVPFKSGVNTASYKYYIDFAKRFGFDRIMMDAGWSNTKDLFDINPNINMDTIAAYAKQQGIKLSMWTLSMTLNKQLDTALKQFKKWGVDFIMTDFIDRDDQPTVNFYKRIAEACAKTHLMIMFHGAYPPKGFNRTYPNNITREGVLGSEYNAWSDKVTASHDCIIPFTRMLAGPLDYEPGLLDNATPQQFRPIWGKVMSQTTRCQQLAMFVVYDDPLPIFSGNPSQGFLEPKFMQLLGSIPAGWDTTIIPDAKAGEYIIPARKKGNDWFIAGITDSSARDITIDLSFLNGGNYAATICRDGINADRNAVDYVMEEKTLTANDKLQIHMAKDGGFLVRLKKE